MDLLTELLQSQAPTSRVSQILGTELGQILVALLAVIGLVWLLRRLLSLAWKLLVIGAVIALVLVVLGVIGI